jgi:hypothetical protein
MSLYIVRATIIPDTLKRTRITNVSLHCKGLCMYIHTYVYTYIHSYIHT